MTAQFLFWEYISWIFGTVQSGEGRGQGQEKTKEEGRGTEKEAPEELVGKKVKLLL
jgi:hypothetical protein